MNTVVNSQILAAKLRLIAKVIPNKPAIQVLGHVLLNTTPSGVVFYATDLEVGLQTSCAATVHAPGTLALPAAHLLALAEQMPNDDVSISLEKAQVKVTCGAFTSRLQAQKADDFPTIPEVKGATSRLSMTALQQLIARTRYAVNAGSAKYVLQGTLLALSGPAAAMVATDGKRLAMATASTEGADASIIIPAKTLDLLALQSEKGDVELTVGERHLFFKTNDALITSRTIDGKFPNYEQIVPRANDKVVSVNRHALSAALRRVRLASAETRAVYLTFDNNTIALSSSSAEMGSADEVVVAVYGGEILRVCLNADYLLDFLDAASGQSISMLLKDANSAMLLTDGDDHLGVISLMR